MLILLSSRRPHAEMPALVIDSLKGIAHQFCIEPPEHPLPIPHDIETSACAQRVLRDPSLLAVAAHRWKAFRLQLSATGRPRLEEICASAVAKFEAFGAWFESSPEHSATAINT